MNWLSTAVVIALVLLTHRAEARGKPEQGGAGPGGGGGAPAAIRVWREAPSLTERVTAGELPEVAKRLPRDPAEVPVADAGSYGGTLRLAVARDALWTLWNTFVGARVLGQDDALYPVPLLIQSYDVSGDQRVFTLHLRPGLRWSDGDPCDADDFRFAWDDVIRNAELTPRKPAGTVAGGRLARFDKIDQYTVSYTFAAPNVVFPRRLAAARSTLVLVLPAHALETYHAAHTDPAALETAALESGYASWVDQFLARASPWSNPELPVLDPWVRSPAGEDPGTLTLRRNPYYWQVDTEGSQLPYLDTVEVTLTESVGAAAGRALSGQADLQLLSRPESPPTLDTAHELRSVEPMHANIHTVFLNRTIQDSVRAALFGNLRFRRALSLAVDRAYLNERLYRGAADVSQVSPAAGTPAFDAAVAAEDTARDFAAANVELDGLGLAWDRSHVWRLDAAGAPLELTVIYPTGWPPAQEEAVTQLADDWGDLGIRVIPLGLDRSVWLDAIERGDWQVTMYAVNAGGGRYLPLSSDGVFPVDRWWLPAPAWGRWLETGGAEGSEPPATVKRLHDLYGEYTGTAGPERAVQIEREAYAVYTRELLGIGILSRPSDEIVAVVARSLANLPDGPLPDDLTLIYPAALWHRP